MSKEVRFYLDIEGEITYISSVEPLLYKDGSPVLGKKSEEPLFKRYIHVMGTDKKEYYVESISSKLPRKNWLDALASVRIGTQIEMKLYVKSSSWNNKEGRKILKNVFMPEMINGQPFKITWMPDDNAPF